MPQSKKQYVLHAFLLIYSIALVALLIFAGKLGYIIYQSPNPETLTSLNTNFVVLDKLPPYVGAAFLASEDIGYIDRPGMETRAIIKTLIRGYLNKGVVPQEITIVQKLVKYAFTKPNAGFPRKLQEAYIAFRLQNKYSRKQILQMYINHADFGESTSGLNAASTLYFGKKPQQLSIAEAALLAGVVKNPATNSPYVNPEKAYAAMNSILATMEADGLLSKTLHQSAQEELLSLKNNPTKK